MSQVIDLCSTSSSSRPGRTVHTVSTVSTVGRPEKRARVQPVQEVQSWPMSELSLPETLCAVVPQLHQVFDKAFTRQKKMRIKRPKQAEFVPGSWSSCSGPLKLHIMRAEGHQDFEDVFWQAGGDVQQKKCSFCNYHVMYGEHAPLFFHVLTELTYTTPACLDTRLLCTALDPLEHRHKMLLPLHYGVKAHRDRQSHVAFFWPDLDNGLTVELMRALQAVVDGFNQRHQGATLNLLRPATGRYYHRNVLHELQVHDVQLPNWALAALGGCPEPYMPPFTCRFGSNPAKWLFNRGTMSAPSMAHVLQLLRQAFPGRELFQQVLLLPEAQERQEHDAQQFLELAKQMPWQCLALASVLAHTLVLQRDGDKLRVYNPSGQVEAQCLRVLRQVLGDFLVVDKLAIKAVDRVQVFEPSCGLHAVAKLYDMLSGGSWAAQHSPEAATFVARMFDCLHGNLPAACTAHVKHRLVCGDEVARQVQRTARSKGKRRSNVPHQRLRWDEPARGRSHTGGPYTGAESSALRSRDGCVCSRRAGQGQPEVRSRQCSSSQQSRSRQSSRSRMVFARR